MKEVEEDKVETSLMVMKGERYPRLWTVPLEAASLNEGDVFILDNDEEIFFWPGKDSNTHENMKAIAVSQHIKNHDRKTHAQVLYPRDDEDAAKKFWALLGAESEPEDIAPAVPDDSE